MRFIFFFLGVLFFIWACTPSKYCASKSNYLKTTDTSKPYKVDGKYCVANTRDTILENGMSVISFKVFDRKTGKDIQSGVAWFNNGIDTLKLLFDNGNGYRKLSAGSYVIDISSLSDELLGLRTKKIELHKNTKMEINFYLGSSLQW